MYLHIIFDHDTYNIGADVGLYDVDHITPYAHAVYRGLKEVAAQLKVSCVVVCCLFPVFQYSIE